MFPRMWRETPLRLYNDLQVSDNTSQLKITGAIVARAAVSREAAAQRYPAAVLDETIGSLSPSPGRQKELEGE